jgi:quinol monooxygenase YgiN
MADRREGEASVILVTGHVIARAETFAEVRRLSLEHVHRSRAEPGCISHDVHVHAENALKLVFVERWADAAALKAHFAVPASGTFVRAISALAAEKVGMEMYEATKVAV